MAVNQDVVKRILTKVMVKGQRYKVGDLQKLFNKNYNDWEKNDHKPIEGVGNVWKAAVKNSVRMSPDREDFSNNTWVELKGEKNGRNFEYWIDEGKVLELGDGNNISSGRKKPKINDGWNAEKLVKRDLEDRGYIVSEVSSGGFGCDLIAKINDDSKPIFIEVKSSVGRCNPVMTENEWLCSRRQKNNYWLAIVENLGQMSEMGLPIFYIKNPSSLEHKKRNESRYSIKRKSWASIIGDDYQECLNHPSLNMEMLEIVEIVETCINNEKEYQIWVQNKCEDCGKVTSKIIERGDFVFANNYYDEAECRCLGGPDLINAYAEEALLTAPCIDCGNRMWYIYPENIFTK